MKLNQTDKDNYIKFGKKYLKSYFDKLENDMITMFNNAEADDFKFDEKEPQFTTEKEFKDFVEFIVDFILFDDVTKHKYSDNVIGLMYMEED